MIVQHSNMVRRMCLQLYSSPFVALSLLEVRWCCNIFFVAVASCAVAFVMLPVMNMTMKAKIDNFFIVFTFLLNKMFLYSRVYLSFANLIDVTKKTLG